MTNKRATHHECALFLLVCNTLAYSPPRVSVETLVGQFTRFSASASYEEGLRRALSLYQQEGFVILRQAFKHTLIEEMRNTVMRYIERRGQLVNTHAFGDRGGWYIPEFPNEELLKQVVLNPIASNAPLRSLLRHIHGVEPRILHRSEIYVDNAAGWHFDGDVGTRAALLAPRVRVPQQCRDRFLFPYPIDETGRTPDGERQSITTVALYLQDHNVTHQREALTLRPGSHHAVSASYSDPVDGGLDAMYKRAGRSPSVTLHPALGDVVVFNQHVHHRGQLASIPTGAANFMQALENTAPSSQSPLRATTPSRATGTTHSRSEAASSTAKPHAVPSITKSAS